jgi:hypothetical protein
VASFTDLALTGTAGDRTLSFTASGLTAATSTTISVTAGTATQLAITTQPSSSAQSGVPFAQQPVVQLRDGAGNAVSQSGVTVTATIATGAGTLGGTLTATTNGSGVATFTDLAISGAAGDRTLSFSASGLTSVESNTVTITAGPASTLVFTVQPSNTQVGATITPPVQVTAIDAFGNIATDFAGIVTIAIGTDGSLFKNANLHGTLTVAAANGVATFGDLSIDQVGGGYTLVVSATGPGGVTSQPFNITLLP